MVEHASEVSAVAIVLGIALMMISADPPSSEHKPGGPAIGAATPRIGAAQAEGPASATSSSYTR